MSTSLQDAYNICPYNYMCRIPGLYVRQTGLQPPQNEITTEDYYDTGHEACVDGQTLCTGQFKPDALNLIIPTIAFFSLVTLNLLCLTF